MVESSSDDCGTVYNGGRVRCSSLCRPGDPLASQFPHRARLDVSLASKLRIDNLSALSVAKNPEHHGRMKHLDLRFYWLRDEVAKGRIEVVHLRTSDMPADILTKSLAKPKVLEMVKMLGLGT